MYNIVINPRLVIPGDLVLAHTRGVFGFLIRAAQGIKWRGWSTWNHAAIVVSNDNGKITVAQMGKRCQEVSLSGVAPGGDYIIVSAPDGVDLGRAVKYAKEQLGTEYGVLTLFSIVFNIFTPRWIHLDFRRGNTLICSALVARSWEHGGWSCEIADPFQIVPAQLAEVRNV